MWTLQLVSDFRESFPTADATGNVLFNDHPRRASIEEVRNALREQGYHCEIFGGVPELADAYTQRLSFPEETLFINMSDGLTQAYSRVQIPILCDMLGVKYSGSGPFEVALMTNKHYSKLAVREKGILCPKGELVSAQNFLSALNRSWNYPVMIKPNTEGSSVGITQENVCFSSSELLDRLKILVIQFPEIIVEEYIQGADATCFLVGNPGDYILNEVLLVEHHGKHFFEREVLEMNDHAHKRTSYIMANDALGDETVEKIKAQTIIAAAALNARDIIRIDYRVTIDGQVFFLEANSVPRISTSSALGHICKSKNLSFPALLSEYVEAILRRVNRD